MPGIGLLLSAHAKRTTADPGLGERLRRTLGDDGLVRSPSTIEELRAVAMEFQSKNIQLVASAGGDGTNHITISGLIGAYGEGKLPYFAMLRCGTMNTVANSFGIPRRSPEKLLTMYKNAYKRRAVRPMQFIEPCTIRAGAQYGFTLGTGAVYGFISEYNQRETRSAGWAARVLGRAVASSVVQGATIKRVAQRWCGRVEFPDGSSFPDRDYLAVAASTCGQIGLGFHPFYRAGESERAFHILAIHASAGEFIRGLPRIWRGISMGQDRCFDRLAERATLVSQDGFVRYQFDGDVYEHEGPLEVAMGPRIRIVVP